MTNSTCKMVPSVSNVKLFYLRGMSNLLIKHFQVVYTNVVAYTLLLANLFFTHLVQISKDMNTLLKKGKL